MGKRNIAVSEAKVAKREHLWERRMVMVGNEEKERSEEGPAICMAYHQISSLRIYVLNKTKIF